MMDLYYITHEIGWRRGVIGVFEKERKALDYASHLLRRQTQGYLLKFNEPPITIWHLAVDDAQPATLCKAVSRHWLYLCEDRVVRSDKPEAQYDCVVAESQAEVRRLHRAIQQGLEKGREKRE